MGCKRRCRHGSLAQIAVEWDTEEAEESFASASSESASRRKAGQGRLRSRLRDGARLGDAT